ncbi:hydrogenase formation protein [Methyloversatilis sp.]|uniref:hydrogenase formation protein n=1 Tax=Methyloversatilis sp. TaxID=2569862 RepID=UPI002736ADFA|nr:hydrogenase formation protein [Methyloversatilis sp.]MDP2869135.1 hydrogenase formation protein [Methyloversatilis sp.]MDP3457172.1 hydrogenase formation protein [Methyloversatilis sp.]MDP3579849.1 hydrogenase formation protein [Methyloversatilis sp.]
MMSLDALAGVLRVQPGAARPTALVGQRPDWAARLAVGRPAQSLPDLLGAVFSLCSHAHRLSARAAVDAARGIDAPPPDTLRSETLREHLRRVLLDWPARLAAEPSTDAQRALATCPALRAEGCNDACADNMPDWIERHLLGLAPAHWLAAFERAPQQAFADWRDGAPSWLARLLRDSAALADAPLAASAPLHVHASEAALRALAAAMTQDPAFTRRPRIDGACAETGCWTRLADDTMPVSASGRFAARLAELVRLALPGGERRLRSGRLTLAPGEGLAWVEMARGLLVHHVQLDGRGDDARIDACHVLAPTEWNFDADGAVAAAIEKLDPAEPDCARRVALLMAAYDPCVRYEVAGAAEVAHA